MFFSRLFWRIFLVYFLLSATASVFFIGNLSEQLRSLVIEHLQQRLHDSAVILSSSMQKQFEEGPSDSLQKQLKTFYNNTDSRFTLITNDGTVIGDSYKNPESMDNHMDRDEIIRASQSGLGRSIRNSSTLGYQMLYYAIRLPGENNSPGYVRVALPMKSVDQEVKSVQKMVWFTASIINIGVLICTYWFIRRIITPVETLTIAALEMSHGRLEQSVEVQSKDEIGKLADSFNRMSSELAIKVFTHEEQKIKLEQNSKLLETVLGSMLEGVVVVDSNKNTLYINNAAKKLLGISAHIEESTPIEEAIRLPVIQGTIEKVLTGNIQERVEFDISRSQCKASMLATRLPGSPCPGAVLVFHDVTELRHLENMRSEFVSNVSHELKTPLTSIQAYTETLLEGAIEDPENNRKFLKRIEEQGNRLHLLILDLLSLAKIESADKVFHLVPIQVSQIICNCIESHLPKAESRNLNITQSNSAPEIKVLADAEGLRTIFDNLVENAINYTPEGGTITIEWHKQEENMCAISVTDTGIGVPAEHHSRIFERFYRVDKARSREMGGTGLGLSIVKHLSQVFGGSVTINSIPGEGTTFTVFLPIAQTIS